MNLSYFHVSADVPEDKIIETAVVIDVLRATTTIACALYNGAEAVQTFSSVNKLVSQSNSWPVKSRLLLGERGGKRLDGFDLGNSPVSVTKDIVKGKRLFMSTTNGTRSLERVIDAKNLFTLALPNRLAVAKTLVKIQAEDVLIVGSGWEGSYSLEDSLAAGALAQILLQMSPGESFLINDEINAALSLWDYWKTNPEGCLRKASHGQRLMGLGNHDADFKCCAELDTLNIVPMQSKKGVLIAA